MEHIQDEPIEIKDANYYDNRIRSLFKYYIEELGYQQEAERGKINGNHAQAIFMRIYRDEFKPSKKLFCNKTSNIDYSDYDLIEAIEDTYITLAKEYNFLATVYGFSLLIGIEEETLYEWARDTHLKGGANCKRSGLVKRLRNTNRSQLQNELYSHPIGVQSLANNERDFGLNYNQQRLLDGAQVAQALTVGELPRLDG